MNDSKYSIFFGRYRLVGDNRYVWEPNHNLKISADDQLKANKENYPNFKLILTNNTSE